MFLNDMPIRLIQGVEYWLAKQVRVKNALVIGRHNAECNVIERRKGPWDIFKADTVMQKHLQVIPK